MRTPSLIAQLALVCCGAPVWAQSTTFRVTGIEDVGRGKVKVDLTIQQGSQAAPIDVWVNTVLPAHRNLLYQQGRGPAVETGMHLGRLPQQISERQSKTESFTLDLKTLNDKLGARPGSTLYFSIKLPAQYNGGHEWGVNGGGCSTYSAGTSCAIPGSCKIAGAPKTKARAAQRPLSVNVNSATADQLAALPGVGSGLASRIVAQRTSQGRFRSVSDLTLVKGIGPSLVRKLTPMVKVSGRSSGLGRSPRR